MLLILGQALANMAMVGGMFAVVGVPLPFISYGGSSLLVTMIAMGILLNICDHGHKPQPKFMNTKEKTEKEQGDGKEKRPSLHLVK
jgi:cell division protein FtsW